MDSGDAGDARGRIEHPHAQERPEPDPVLLEQVDQKRRGGGRI